jgi:TetR/AcrR family transcriptional regulator, transcriptional repressor for nem operon
MRELRLNLDVLRTRKAAKGTRLPRRSTRNAILEAAMKEFIARGFSACSVEDITKAARVPKGSFYNHFKSKQSLAAEIVTEYGKGVTERSVLADPAIAPLRRLKRHFAALNEHFSCCQDGCLVGKFMAEVSVDTPQIRESLRRVLKVWEEELASALSDGQRQGSIRKDLPASDLAAFLIDSYEGAILRTRLEKKPRALTAFMTVVFSSIIT